MLVVKYRSASRTNHRVPTVYDVIPRATLSRWMDAEYFRGMHQHSQTTIHNAGYRKRNTPLQQARSNLDCNRPVFSVIPHVYFEGDLCLLLKLELGRLHAAATTG